MKHLAETLPPPTARRTRKSQVAEIVSLKPVAPVRMGHPSDAYHLTEPSEPLEHIMAYVSLGSIVQQPGFRVLQTYAVPFIDIDLDEGPTLPARSSVLGRIARYAEKNPTFGCRVYLTRAGLRLIVTSHELPPHASDMIEMMRELGADPKYVTFCLKHRRYAARLDPKQERCDDPTAVYATTEFLWYVGVSSIQQNALRIIEVHDKETRAKSGGPLA